MARQIMSTEDKVTEKRERVPVHESRDKIKTRGLDKDNFYYRFIHIDDVDNVDKHLAAGYEFVTKGGGRTGENVVDKTDGLSSVITIQSRARTLALVCLPWELWNQDEAAREAKRKELEAGMKASINSQAGGKLGPGVVEFGSQLGSLPTK